MPSNKKTRKGANEKMMNDAVIKRNGLHIINLADLDGEGSFPAPHAEP